MSVKRLLISHVDLDGMLPLVITYLYNDKLCFDKVTSQDYGFEKKEDIWNLMLEYDEIIIADLSMEKEYAEKLRSLGKHVEFYDHHSAADWIGEDPDSVYDNSTCGTKIFFDHYVKPRITRYNPVLDYVIKLVETYDCWKEEDPLWQEAKNLNSVLYGFCKWDDSLDMLQKAMPFIEHMELKISRSKGEWNWDRKELEIIQRANDREERSYKEAMQGLQTRRDAKNRKFGVITATSKISLICSRILREKEDLDYIICFSTYGGMTGKLSVRTKKDFDLNELCCAKGHESATGGQVSPELAIKFYNNRRLCFRYREDEEFKDGEESSYIQIRP